MSVLRMTLLAQQRTRGDQELLVVRAVRRVAVDATVAHRRMLEQERPALLRVAGVADLVHAVGLEQRLGRAAVRIVTIDAATRPSSSGICERRENSARCVLWHWKQVSLIDVRACRPCSEKFAIGLWQSAHARSWLSCVELAQKMRCPPR